MDHAGVSKEKFAFIIQCMAPCLASSPPIMGLPPPPPPPPPLSLIICLLTSIQFSPFTYPDGWPPRWGIYCQDLMMTAVLVQSTLTL